MGDGVEAEFVGAGGWGGGGTGVGCHCDDDDEDGTEEDGLVCRDFVLNEVGCLFGAGGGGSQSTSG